MDKTHNTKGIYRTLSPLFKISTNGMAPKTKLLSPQFHVMFDDNIDTIHAPDPNITQADTMDRLFKTNRYKYENPF
jgi:hypothetical protein